MDSGATCHVVKNKEQFISFDSTHREKLSVANGQQVMSEGKGTVRIEFLNVDNKKSTVLISNALYIPTIGGNLISVHCLVENG